MKYTWKVTKQPVTDRVLLSCGMSNSIERSDFTQKEFIKYSSFVMSLAYARGWRHYSYILQKIMQTLADISIPIMNMRWEFVHSECTDDRFEHF